MTQKKYILTEFFLVCLMIFVFNPNSVIACSCGPTPNVLESFENSDQIVIVKAISVEKVKEDEEIYTYGGIKSTKMFVEKVYKGDLKVGSEMTFAQGGGADCIWTFNESSIGKEYLLYLGSPEKNQKMWVAFGCGRSNSLEGAAEDLNFLNNLNTLLGKTRISGSLECDLDICPSIEGRKVKILGNGKTYNLKTDKKGNYEIYGLPAGKYLIEPEMPSGWKVDDYYLQNSTSYMGDPDAEIKGQKQFPIMLENRKHALLDFHFEIDNEISGKIFDPNGKPMKDVCIKAVSAELKAGDYRGQTDCTDAEGSFSISEVSPDNYILVINDEGKIDSDEPFKTLFYPGVFEREKAGVVSIAAGQFLKNINIQIPAFEEVVTIEGKFLYADGKPVIDESVKFEPSNAAGKKIGDFRARTDQQGSFSMRILKGLKGNLFGDMTIYKPKYKNCPHISKLIEVVGQMSWKDVQTEALQIDGEKNLFEIELKLPFASCKKLSE